MPEAYGEWTNVNQEDVQIEVTVRSTLIVFVVMNMVHYEVWGETRVEGKIWNDIVSDHSMVSLSHTGRYTAPLLKKSQNPL